MDPRPNPARLDRRTDRINERWRRWPYELHQGSGAEPPRIEPTETSPLGNHAIGLETGSDATGSLMPFIGPTPRSEHTADVGSEE